MTMDEMNVDVNLQNGLGNAQLVENGTALLKKR